MDQVKEYLEVLKKHHFWLLLVIAIGAGIVAYRSGASTFSATYSSRKSSIEGKFSDVSRVASTPNHPNQTFIDGIEKLHDEEKQLTLAAWQTLYEKQGEVLRWPEQFRSIENLPDNAEIDANDRYAYMNYARDQLPRLLDIVKVRHKETIVDENGDEKEVERGLVEWDEQSRSELERLFEWDRQPTTKRVRYTQEALWVYEALLEIIAKTNAGATAFYNAPIKEILELQIAQAASQPVQSDVELYSPSGSGPPEPRGSSSSAPTVPGPDATDEELGEGRYVDSQGNPIAATQAETGEFKLMPIRMKLVMDQRKIPDLLANCANSELTVEVRRVRINPDVKPQQGPQGGVTSRSRSTGMSSGRGQASASGDVEDPYDVTVELYGLIYIYNRPDRQRLGIADANGPTNGAPGAQVPGATPAAAVPNNAAGPGS